MPLPKGVIFVKSAFASRRAPVDSWPTPLPPIRGVLPTHRRCCCCCPRRRCPVPVTPDLAKFKMASLDDDTVALLCKRVYDIAGCCNSYQGARLQVYLNGKKLPVKNFQQYMDLYQVNPRAAHVRGPARRPPLLLPSRT